MRLSDIPEYLRYGAAKAAGDLAAARQAIEACLQKREVQEDPIQCAGLLQMLAEIHFELRDIAAALECHERAQARDPTSLLVQYLFARFLAQSETDLPGALAKCDRIIADARAANLPPTTDDLGSAEYTRMAETLRASILQQMSP